MYSAFSFGKVIKTILPGSVLTATLFLVPDTVTTAYERNLMLLVSGSVGAAAAKPRG